MNLTTKLKLLCQPCDQENAQNQGREVAPPWNSHALKLYSNSWRINGTTTTPKKKAQNSGT